MRTPTSFAEEKERIETILLKYHFFVVYHTITHMMKVTREIKSKKCVI